MRFSSLVLKVQKQSPLEVFCEKGVLKNFAKFTEKHLCWSLFVKNLPSNKKPSNKVCQLLNISIVRKLGPNVWNLKKGRDVLTWHSEALVHRYSIE